MNRKNGLFIAAVSLIALGAVFAILLLTAERGVTIGGSEDSKVGSAALAPMGTMTANPNPCMIAQGKPGCISTISWSTRNLNTPNVVVVVRNQMFACVGANVPFSKETGEWINEDPKTFELWPATSCSLQALQRGPLATVTVRGVRQNPTATMAANPCLIPQGQAACVANITWTTQNTGWVQVRIGGKMFACTPEGKNSALTGAWITQAPAVFTLHMGCAKDAPGPALATLSVVGIPQQSIIKGVNFNPETYTTSGAPVGNAWVYHYFTPGIREQAKAEMRALKEKTGATHIVVPASALWQLSWPNPTTDELDKMAAIINDANAAGFKVILTMGHPYIVPKSHLKPEAIPKAVCGHKTGDIVNGFTLFWDVPDCPENNIELSKEWFRQSITGIESRLSDPRGIAYIQLSGHVGMPFAAEMNMFYDGNPYLADAQRYIQEMVPYLNSMTQTPIAAFLMSLNLDGPAQRRSESSLRNVLAAVPLEQWDYIDIAWSPNVRINEIEGMNAVLTAAPQKIVLSDGKPNLMSGMTQAQVIAYHFDLAEQRRLAGFWYWTYKDAPAQPEFIGIRQHGFSGTEGGWKQEAVDAFRAG